MNLSDIKFFLLIGLVGIVALVAYALTKKKIDAKGGTGKFEEREYRFVHPTTPGAKSFDEYRKEQLEERKRR